MREIDGLTGMSRRTLHAWMNMFPIPEIHYGLAGPRPGSIAESALRTMGEQPARDWLLEKVRAAMPADRPTGDEATIAQAMQSSPGPAASGTARAAGYRIAPPS
jgi:hypothetical protein